MVSIFLNLSAIPDDVVSRLRISEDDYSINIAEQMTPILSSKSSPTLVGSKENMYIHYNAYREFLVRMELTTSYDTSEKARRAKEKKFELEKALAAKKKNTMRSKTQKK